jgi:phage FluMu protein Com
LEKPMSDNFDFWQLQQEHRERLKEASRAERRAEHARVRFTESLLNDGMLFVWHVSDKCPRCHGTDLATVRTEHHFGIKMHRKSCRCGHKFFIGFQSAGTKQRSKSASACQNESEVTQ